MSRIKLRVPTSIFPDGTILAHQQRLLLVLFMIPNHDVALEHDALAQKDQIGIGRQQRWRENLMGYSLQHRLDRRDRLEDAHGPE